MERERERDGWRERRRVRGMTRERYCIVDVQFFYAGDNVRHCVCAAVTKGCAYAF